ncbi:hypothetical protein MFIFM68171_08440 [Madurella fahalii]|uniref:WSC domain-containing protein n=1 Tax=Madurella fahalii TaxID=1157608 RepID=A0ABQ0GKC7_9PEZI
MSEFVFYNRLNLSLAGRALTGKAERSDDMDVETCAGICSEAGYSLFGLEYYTECFCGNAFMPGATPAPESDCGFPCSGNPNDMCGGDWRLYLYQFGDAPASTATSSSTTIPTPAPVGYASEGYYTEASNGRALSDASFYDDSMTVQKCATACNQYTWCGVEYGRECFCGNTVNEGSVPTSNAECSFPCPGDTSQTSGAGSRLNMYRKTVQESSTSSSSPVTDSATSVASSTINSTISEAAMTSSSSVLPEITASSSTSSSIAGPSSSTILTTVLPPEPTNPVVNSDFEGDLNSWIVKTLRPIYLTYNFQNPDQVHTGLYSGSITYLAGAQPVQA